MKHNATLLIAAFSLMYAHSALHAMEKDSKPKICCAEDIAIVLHFVPEQYSKRDPESTDNSECNKCLSSFNHINFHKKMNIDSGFNPTLIAYNPVNHNTKINDISFNDHMQRIEEKIKEASQQKDTLTNEKIAYEQISIYLIASHSKHIPRNEDNLALPTVNYFRNAEEKISQFYYKNFRKNNDETDYDFFSRAKGINLAKIFYKASHNNNNKQKEQNDIELIMCENNEKIKICDNATIDTRFNYLTLNIPDNITIKRSIHPMASEKITKGDITIMDIHGYCNTIILMDV